MDRPDVRQHATNLGIRAGDTLLVSGPCSINVSILLAQLLKLLTPSGTLVAAGYRLERRTQLSGDDLPVLPHITPDYASDGLSDLQAALWGHSDAIASGHPVYPFAAIGHNAEYITRNQPFQYPLGENSPMSKMHQLNGKILTVGNFNGRDSVLPLAEVWSDLPYIRRSAMVCGFDSSWRQMNGDLRCSQGYERMESILRQARIVRSTDVEGIPWQCGSIQGIVSMGMELLKGDQTGLLCTNPDCEDCMEARAMVRESTSLPSREREL
ncbi:MAG: AAC(3) family N-acetyltransferase [Chthonomonadales bacterium]